VSLTCRGYVLLDPIDRLVLEDFRSLTVGMIRAIGGGGGGGSILETIATKRLETIEEEKRAHTEWRHIGSNGAQQAICCCQLTIKYLDRLSKARDQTNRNDRKLI
jgi:hypothetical protein